MGHIYSNILETIGRTPVIRINRLAPPGVDLFVKVEAFNPMGSVKDRMALSVIEQAENAGNLKPGQTVIEATSGNTGIGLAMVCAAKGYPLVLTMAESFSLERRKILRFLGARVVLTPAEDKGSGMVAKAVELAKAHGWFLVRQFENQANADAHTRTTAVEILDAFAERGLDYFVTGYGTGGTLKGTGRVLRERSPNTRIIVCEPDNSPILGSGIPQDRNADGSVSLSHPKFRPHLMQGWTPDFIPKLTEDAVALGFVDEILEINGEHAMEMCRRLAREEGIFCGTSSGATFSGAVRVAESAPPGSSILCMLPDTGERYLSTPLFADVPVDMSEVEEEISRSTPNYRFDVRPPATPPQPEALPAAQCGLRPPKQTPAPATAAAVISAGETAPASAAHDAEKLYDEAMSDPQHRVVLFALEWCEFCWSVRKLFAELEIDFRAIDLDSAALQDNDLGEKVRGVLNARTGARTIPQVFIAGNRIGGATDTFDAYKSGEFQEALRKAGVPFKNVPDLDPYHLLPSWMHARI